MGIRIDTFDDFGLTPFIKSVSNNNKTLIDFFLESGANINALDLSGRTALMLCAEHGNKELAEKLLKYGNDINFKSSYTGYTALTHAVLKNQIEMVKWLIDHNAEIDSEDKLGWTPLMHAFLYGFNDIANVLLENGADKFHQEHGFARKGHWITAADLEQQHKQNTKL